MIVINQLIRKIIKAYRRMYESGTYILALLGVGADSIQNILMFVELNQRQNMHEFNHVMHKLRHRHGFCFDNPG